MGLGLVALDDLTGYERALVDDALMSGQLVTVPCDCAVDDHLPG